MSNAVLRQKLIKLYREETGNSEVDMRDVAAFAVRKGWSLPKPQNPMDMLAKQFADAARQEFSKDRNTGRPYRVYHAVPKQDENGQSVFFWIDIDDPATTAKNFRKSAVMRREQMVDDGFQLSLDLDHWNSIRPEDDHLALPWDLTLDIEWRKNAMDDDDDEGKSA
jgi:hypothetical protein